MAKLSKAATKAHKEAQAFVDADRKLLFDEREFLVRNWRPDAEHNVTTASAFFTPFDLAQEASIERLHGPRRVLDLCAGIGGLSFAQFLGELNPEKQKWVCVEQNPAYVEIGKRLMPEAEWHCGSMLDRKLMESLGEFDEVISNPPYGKMGFAVETDKEIMAFKKDTKDWLGYWGQMEYMAAAVAMKMAPHGIFILMQQRCPFKFSHQDTYTKVDNADYEKFSKASGVNIGMNCGIDTSYAADQWQDVNVRVEIALLARAA